MNDLAARKRLLVAESDLHRQIIALEYRQLRSRWSGAQQIAGRGRWWLLGGSTLLGAVLARRGRGLARWIPVGLTLWRMFRK